MLTREERIEWLTRIVENNIVDVHDFVDLFELSIEDMLEAFPNKLLEYEYKLVALDPEDQDEEDFQKEVAARRQLEASAFDPDAEEGLD